MTGDEAHLFPRFVEEKLPSGAAISREGRALVDLAFGCWMLGRYAKTGAIAIPIWRLRDPINALMTTKQCRN